VIVQQTAAFIASASSVREIKRCASGVRGSTQR
jgi:hypothetical protein